MANAGERTIYAMNGTEADDHDELLGMMDMEWVARYIVELHNAKRSGET